MKRLLLLTLLIPVAVLVHAQAEWSYLKQATPAWPGAMTKDILATGDSLYAFGEVGLIDIEEGALRLTKLHAGGEVAWEQEYDKPGTMEIAQRITGYVGGVWLDGGMIASSILMPGYRPYFQLIHWGGSELWNSAAWSDALPENSASQTYGYVLPSGDVACVVADDVSRTVTRYLVDDFTGALISSTTVNYADIIPFDPGDLISSATADFTHDDDGNCIVIAGFNIMGTDTTDYIFKFNSDFEFVSRFGIANEIPQLAPHSVIINSEGNYVITGSKNSGAFFDLYTPVIITVDADFLYAWTVSFDPVLAQAMAGAITQTNDGGYKWIWYNMSGAYYDPAVGDFIDVVTLDMSYTETAHHTVQYAPYDIFECIVAAPEVPAIDDAYVIGGMSWDIGVPAYQTVIAAGADDAMPACLFNCVWPGDADNSGLVDMDDLLSIGLGFGATGPARDAVDIAWSAHAAEEWTTALPGDINHKYTDCNGDGVIDATDEEAVDVNYSFEHAVYTLKTSEGDVPLYFAPTGPLVIGENAVPIFLGNELSAVDAIYGIRFTAVVTSEAVDASTIQVTFNDSFIGSMASALQLSKTHGDASSADAALVKTDQTNASGYGEIGTLNFVVIDNIAGKKTADEITFDFAGVRAINVLNEEIELAPASLTVDITLNTNEPFIPAISMYPNPVSGNMLYATIDLSGSVVTMLNLQGQHIPLRSVTANAIELPELPAGQYLLRVSNAMGTSVLSVHLQ